MYIHHKKKHNQKNSFENQIILKSFFKNSVFFIFFSLLNVLLPIFVCMIAASMSNKGAFAVIGIGYVTAFQLAYCQIGFTFAIFASFFILKKHGNKFQNSKIKETIFLTMFYGILMLPLYIIPSWIYSKYASAHINTQDSLDFAYNYIWTSSGFIFLTTLRSTLTLIVYKKDKKQNAIIFESISYIIMIVISIALSFYTQLNNGIGLGLGLTIGSVISIIFLLSYCAIRLKIFKNNNEKFQFKKVRYILSFTWKQSLITIAIQIFKAITLLSLSFLIPNAILGAVPLNYQMARLVWYNFLYLIPFVLTGMTDATYYWFSENSKKINRENGIKIISVIIVISIIMTILVSTSANFAIKPLSNFYIQNSLSSYDGLIFTPNKDILQKPLHLDMNTQESILKTIKEKIDNSSLDENLKNKILNYINTNEQFKNLTLNLALSPLKDSFTSFNGGDIDSMINLPKSWTYLYISVYCLTYPVGVLMNAFLYSITRTKPKVWFLIIAEAIAIAFIVSFGVNFQTTSRFYLMDAWSFPLFIIGIISVLYLVPNFFIKIMKYQQINNQSNRNYLFD